MPRRNSILAAVLSTLLCCAAGSVALAADAPAADSSAASAVPTSQPADPNVLANELQLRANQDMGRGDYASALPLLQKVSGLISDQPDLLGSVMEQIRVCQRQIQQPGAGQPNVPATQPAQSVVAAIDGATRHIHFRPADGEVLQLPIKELGNFDYDAETGGSIPADVHQLDGCKFRTSGYMIPLDQAESISEFALVPSLFACCFGQPPQVQHTIVVHCPKGKALSYFPDELTVQGTLHVQEQRDGGFIVSIFQMDADSVQAVDK